MISIGIHNDRKAREALQRWAVEQGLGQAAKVGEAMNAVAKLVARVLLDAELGPLGLLIAGQKGHGQADWEPRKQERPEALEMREVVASALARVELPECVRAEVTGPFRFCANAAAYRRNKGQVYGLYITAVLVTLTADGTGERIIVVPTEAPHQDVLASIPFVDGARHFEHAARADDGENTKPDSHTNGRPSGGRKE